MFIPNTNGKYPYPQDTSMHYIEVNKDRGIIFDENYPFVDNSSSFKFNRFWVRLLLCTIVFPFTKFKMGLRIEGKNNLKTNKDILKNGVISVSNHVNFWDYICVMKSLHLYDWPYLLSWDKNVNGESGPLVRYVGGIPIPENNNKATLVFSNTIDDLLKDGHILHIFPEGSMWEYYAPIRPFKRGAFTLAIKNNKPILPLGFSYRRPNWLRRTLFKQTALFTLRVGEPIYPSDELDRSEKVEDFIKRVHEEVCRLSNQNNNIYEPIYNNSKRIDL